MSQATFATVPTAQPALAETVGTLVPGTRSASSSASPPSRHLPTDRARSRQGHRPRHPRRLCPADTCRHARSWHTVSVIRSVSAQPTPPDRPCTILTGAPSTLCSALPPSRTRRHTRHTRSWHAVSLILSVSAQPKLADKPCTFLAGAPFALCSALAPGRHLPTHSAHSFLARGPRHPQRLRPAGTCRQALHVPRWGTARAMLSATAQPTPGDTLCTLVPVDGHYTPQRALRNQSPGLAARRQIRRGSRLPTSRNPWDGLASCGEIRRASRP